MTPQPTETKFTAARLWAAGTALALHELNRTCRNVPCLIDKNGHSDKCWRQWYIDLDKNDQTNESAKDRIGSFLVDYRVPRSFGRANSPSRIEVLEHVQNVVAKWDNSSLSKKAEDLMKDLPGRNLESKNPRKGPESAASKIAWFISPSRWTLFDSRAANALGENKFWNFYKLLEDNDFDTFCEVSDGILSDHELHCKYEAQSLHGSRVLDKALYILGGIRNYKWIEEFDGNHIDNRAAPLIDNRVTELASDVGEKIAQELKNHPISEHLKQRFQLQ